MSQLPPRGRLLGIDFGTVRVGLAITDPDRILASPLATYTRSSAIADAQYLAGVISENQAVGIIIGLPIHSDGRESDKSREVRVFAEWLRTFTPLPLIFWDERFSTARAEEALIFAKLKPQERKARRDRVAAQMILQAFLDAGCPPEGTQSVPDEPEAPQDDDLRHW